MGKANQVLPEKPGKDFFLKKKVLVKGFKHS